MPVNRHAAMIKRLIEGNTIDFEEKLCDRLLKKLDSGKLCYLFGFISDYQKT